MIRLALVGCGQIAMAAHLPALAALRDEGLVEVTACDVDGAKAEGASKRFGMKAAVDWEEVAGGGIDAVAVCVPPGPNADIAIRALDLGLHVLCEKPPGRDAGQAVAMAAAACEHADRVSMVGLNRRFSPLYRQVIERSRQLGPPTSFYGRFTRDALGSQPSNTAVDWITSDSSHAIDLAVATMGLPHAVSVARDVVGPGPDNAWTVQLHAEQGSAVLLFNYAAGRHLERYEWAGPGYDALIEIPKRLEWSRSGNPVETLRGVDLTSSPDEAFTKGFVDQYRCFLGAVAGTAPRPDCDFAYGAELMRLVGVINEAPTGTLQDLCRARPAPSRGPVAPPRPAEDHAGPASVRTARPMVFLHHPIAAHPRFFSPDRLATLKTMADVRSWTGTDADRAALSAADVLVTGRGAPKVRPELLEQAPNLALVVVLGASIRHLGPQALLERGVRICNTADTVAQGVAEHCLMMSLAGLRQLTQVDRAMHGGEWPRPVAARPQAPGIAAVARRLPVPEAAKPLLRKLKRAAAGLKTRLPGRPKSTGGYRAASDLHGQVVGLIGWGHTARRFAQLLAPFGCELLIHSEGADAEALRSVGARAAALGTILGSARVISLHKGLTEQTRGFLDAPLLSQIRSGSVLVNTARGELIDETALIDRLRRGDIVAALDVFDEEPLPGKHPLRDMDNVILTPHNASTTSQEEQRMGDQALDTVIEWAHGRRPDSIDSHRLARMT